MNQTCGHLVSAQKKTIQNTRKFAAMLGKIEQRVHETFEKTFSEESLFTRRTLYMRLGQGVNTFFSATILMNSVFLKPDMKMNY